MPRRGYKKSERPFRIFDEGARRDLPWRSYTSPKRAIEKCLQLLYWLEVGNSYTVYSAEGYKGIAQFTRTVDGIKVLSEKYYEAFIRHSGRSSHSLHDGGPRSGSLLQ